MAGESVGTVAGGAAGAVTGFACGALKGRPFEGMQEGMEQGVELLGGAGSAVGGAVGSAINATTDYVPGLGHGKAAYQQMVGNSDNAELAYSRANAGLLVAGAAAVAVAGAAVVHNRREEEGWSKAEHTAKMEWLPGVDKVLPGGPPAFFGPVAKHTNLAPVHTYVESRNSYTGEARRHEKLGKYPEGDGRHEVTSRYDSPGRGTTYDSAIGDERRVARAYDQRAGHYNLIGDNCERASNDAMRRLRD